VNAYEWDEAKNRANIRKHGIDFVDAVEVFRHPHLASRDDRFDYGEERWIAIGWMRALVVVVAYTERQAGCVRIISARKATANEVRRYGQELEN
jgi:uncharacterized DUF497 family protein